MNRRHFLSALSAAAGTGLSGLTPATAQTFSSDDLPPDSLFLPPEHPLQEAWSAWKSLCLLEDGRVVDGFQGNVSHSEGQGYGLVLASIFGDRAAADQIMAWTMLNLTMRNDSLLAWRWYPDRSPPVPDLNNASDGDLFYAWGLVLAARRDNRPELLEAAQMMAADLLRRCTAPDPGASGREFLLPGANGFREEGRIIINPSYYMPRAMRDIARATGQPALELLAEDGQALIGALAERGPVPDWVEITAAGVGSPPPQFSANSGYEAVRVALFQIWSGVGEGRTVSAWAAAHEAAGPAGGAVTVFALPTGAVMERSSHAGYSAVASLSQCTISSGFGSLMPAFTTEQPYYPATLHLMALVAQATTYPRCVPI